MKNSRVSPVQKIRKPSGTTVAERTLLDALCGIRDAATMRQMLRELLTPGEYASLRKRWIILRMLREGHTQREVAKAIGGSLCNVTRGARILRTGKSVAAALAVKAEPRGKGPAAGR
jgi:TrpR family trp operon transcriptional repressor